LQGLIEKLLSVAPSYLLLTNISPHASNAAQKTFPEPQIVSFSILRVLSVLYHPKLKGIIVTYFNLHPLYMLLTSDSLAMMHMEHIAKGANCTRSKVLAALTPWLESAGYFTSFSREH
jgi:hypothetical protein